MRDIVNRTSDIVKRANDLYGDLKIKQSCSDAKHYKNVELKCQRAER